jgi:MFS family permease
MLVMSVLIMHMPRGMAPPYWAGLLLGLASGAAMIPYTIIKEVNPDEVKGSATGAINFLVFSLSALMAPVFGWLLAHAAGGGPLTLSAYQDAGMLGLSGVMLAIVFSCFIRETGPGAKTRAVKR